MPNAEIKEYYLSELQAKTKDLRMNYMCDAYYPILARLDSIK